MTPEEPQDLSAEDQFSFEGVTMELPRSVPRKFRKYRGESFRLQTQKRRSIVWLTGTEATMFGAEDPGSLLSPGSPASAIRPVSRVAFANFRHQEKHWIAVIRVDSVQTVLVQQEVFLRGTITRRPLAAHGQLRFLLSDSAKVELLPQEEGQAPYEGPPVDDFIASAEAVPPRIHGFPDYSLYGGARGWFRQSLRFISTEEKAAAMLSRNHTVNQFLLHLNPGEPAKVFLEALRRSHEIGLSTRYNTLAMGGTQCVYEMFNILDRSILDTRDDTGFLASLYRKFDRMPLFVGRYLERRGLSHTEPTRKHFPTLNEEMDLSPEELEHLHQKLETFASVQS